MKRALLIILLSMALLIFVRGETLADTFPSKPINLWVGWGAGSGTDISQRAIATIASKTLNQPILVSNVTGGGGTLVLGRLKAEKPDGYTIANTSSATLGRIPHLQPVPYNAQDPLKDFIPIMSYSYYLYGLAVKSDSPWKTFEEVLAYARQNPGKFTYATAGVGVTQHITMERIAMKEGIKWSMVPFKSGAETATACLGGHVNAVAASGPADARTGRSARL